MDTDIDQPQHRFRYFADPACIASLALYAINRFFLKPHHIGGWFTHGYLNDVLCLPLFVPIILYAEHVIGLRKHARFPRAWEILQGWAAFSFVFQAVIPRFSKVFITAGDPYDMLAYAAGGILAALYWSIAAHRQSTREAPILAAGGIADTNANQRIAMQPSFGHRVGTADDIGQGMGSE